MVRIHECFECGAKEEDCELIFSKTGPILCKKCNEKANK